MSILPPLDGERKEGGGEGRRGALAAGVLTTAALCTIPKAPANDSTDAAEPRTMPPAFSNALMPPAFDK